MISDLLELMNADSQRIFDDWGCAVQLEDVRQTYDPESGRVEESVTSSTITAVRQPDKVLPINAASATASLTRRAYLVRRQDVPEGTVLTSARLMVNDVTYHVRTVSESQVAGILLLECVSDGLPE